MLLDANRAPFGVAGRRKRRGIARRHLASTRAQKRDGRSKLLAMLSDGSDGTKDLASARRVGLKTAALALAAMQSLYGRETWAKETLPDLTDRVFSVR